MPASLSCCHTCRGSRGSKYASMCSRACFLAVVLSFSWSAQPTLRARAQGRQVSAAEAPTDAEPVEAGPYGELIESALREYRAHRFHEARSLFAKAHAVLPNARTLRGLGLVEFELRNYVESAALLERALAEHKRALTGTLRGETEQLWRKAEGFLARFDLESALPLTVRVDGVERERSPGEPLAVAVGDHLLEFSAPGYIAERRIVRVHGGEREPLRVALQPVDPTLVPAAKSTGVRVVHAGSADGDRASEATAQLDVSPTAAARSELADEGSTALVPKPQAPRDERRPLYKNKWLWTGVVVVTAAAAVGLGFGLSAEQGGGTQEPISARPIASRSGP